MANIGTELKNWSTTEASNQPDSTDATTLVGDLRAIQSGVRYIYSQDTIASATTCDLGSKTAGSLTISGTTTITGLGTVSAGVRKSCVFSGILTLTHNGTSLILPGAANITTAANDRAEFESLGSGNWRCNWYVKADGTPVTALSDLAVTTAKLAEGVFNGLTAVAPALGDSLAAADASDSGNKKKVEIADILGLVRSYLAGLTLSTAGSSATMSIAAGVASDSASAELMSLSSAISKTTSAWAVGTGNGGLDTGTIANSTWYYFYLIRRADTGVVDVVFSTSSSSPTLPTDYTQYRYIGAGLTNGSAQWVKFTQVGDEFWWDTPVLDYSGAGVVAGALLTCSVPRGRKVKGFFNVSAVSNPSNAVYLSDPDNADLAPSFTTAPLGQAGGNSGASAGVRNADAADCWTDTSAQIRHRATQTNTLYITTKGWVDYRGRMD